MVTLSIIQYIKKIKYTLKLVWVCLVWSDLEFEETLHYSVKTRKTYLGFVKGYTNSPACNDTSCGMFRSSAVSLLNPNRKKSDIKLELGLDKTPVDFVIVWKLKRYANILQNVAKSIMRNELAT